MGIDYRLERIQGQLDQLPDSKLPAALKVVASWPVFDIRVETIRRNRRANELLTQFRKAKTKKAKSSVASRTRRFLAGQCDNLNSDQLMSVT